MGAEIVQRNRQRESLIIKRSRGSGGWADGKKQNNNLTPSGLLTLIAPEVGESIRFNQEAFRLSTKKQVLINHNNRVAIDQETQKALKFFQKNIKFIWF